ncbi:dynein axonemal assembly factor 8-like [Ptychodera flava]|uniref:dynein axonemal assembly factor 8-like n=1 Tax=Ptychodera flava TaxID=63121 RepID=UPI00396A5820
MSGSKKSPNKSPAESNNHTVEFVALPEGTGLKPQLDSIFAEVQASLPSIDFELSDASSDEEVSIFNRSLKSPSAEADERSDDSDTVSSDELPTTPTPSNEVTPNFTAALAQLDNAERRNRTVPAWDDEEFTQSWGDMTESNTRENENRKANTSDNSADSEPSAGILTEDDKESIDEDKDSGTREKDMKVTKDENENTTQKELLLKSSVYSDFLPTERPTLSMQIVDNVDLDGLLEVIDQEKGSTEVMEDSKETSKLFDTHGDAAESKSEGYDNQTLMDKLAQLCIQQSGGNVSADQLYSASKPKRAVREAWPEQTLHKTASGDATSTHRVRPKTSSTGVSTGVSTSMEFPQKSKTEKQEEKETIFLDLRDFDLKKQEQAAGVDAIQRILGIQQETRDDVSDDGSDDDMATWHQQRRQIRDTISSGKTPTDDMWGSSTKPVPYKPTRKVRKIRKSELFSQQNQELTNSVQSKADDNKADAVPTVEQAKPSKLTPTKEENLRKDLKDKERQLEKEKQKKAEAAKKLREQREQERQSRVRLQRQLETLRPRCSVSGKHGCADSTPTIFDLEASYEPAPQTLPPILKSDQECLMMTVHLTSNGEVMAHRSSGNRKVDNTSGISATYAALLTWLLSLVPENYDFLQREVPSTSSKVELKSTEAPFCVIGLQQLWQENFLSLAVAITPRDKIVIKNTPTKKKSRMRDEFKDSSPFQQSVTKFLSTNTIQTVCPWLQGLFAYEVGGKSQVLKSSASDNSGVQADGSYRPTLPAVTTKPLSTLTSLSRDLHAVENTFTSTVGFFWQTVDCEENLIEQDVCKEYNGNAEIQNTLSLIYKHIYHDPHAMMGVLYRVLQEGLDLSGIRVLYPTGNFIPNVHSAVSVNEKRNASSSPEQQLDSDLQTMNTVGAIVALALRGHCARSKWLDAVGPSDPQLARRTDPLSLCAKYGGESRDEVWLFCPRNPARINSELARWFGGRVPPSGVIDVGVTNPLSSSNVKKRAHSPTRKKPKKGSSSQEDDSLDSNLVQSLPSRRPPATLTASAEGDVFLTVSALVPTQCVGIIVAECQNRGFQLRGIRRVRLSVKRANSMGIVGTQLAAFCPVAFHTPVSPMNLDDAIQEQLLSGPTTSRQPPRPGTILLLRKENAMHLVHSLIEALMVKLSLLGLLIEIQSSHDDQVKACHCFHATPFSDSLLQTLGGDFCRTPLQETRTSMMSSGYFYSSAELEQVVVITLTGVSTMKSIGNTLGRILGLTDKPGVSDITAGLELLGIKWLPVLSTMQAKEITPFEVGDKYWQTSIRTLMSAPTLLCVFRGINAFQKLQSLLNIPKSVTGLMTTMRSSPLTTLMSPSAEVAYRQASLFFHPKELYADPTMRPNLKFLPPVRTGHIVTPGTPGSPSDYWTNDDGPGSKGNKHKGRGGKHRSSNIVYVEEAIFDTMLSGPRPLTTLVVIKPDAFQRHLGKILKRICQESFNVVGMRLEVLSADEAKVLVPPCDVQNEVLCKMHVDYLTSSPALILCLQRENAIKKLLDLIGPVNPQQAKKTNQFLWRSLFGVDPINNGLHASCSYSASVMEQKLFFPHGLCCPESPDLQAEKITCPAHDPIIDSGIHGKYKYLLKDSQSGKSDDSLC